ncbi:MAG: transcriptional repressor [Deltaproteobacteria bacterium]|nr:transcriptional repressor [Nannocystaceae bacterium]
MTVAQPDDVTVRALHAAGLRATPARRWVLDTLRAAKTPMTHAEVSQCVVEQSWDQATIFRNLNALVDAGLAVRTDVGDRVWRFSVPHAAPLGARVGAIHSGESAGATHQHPHLLCTACGAVKCIPGAELRFVRGARVPRSVRSQFTEIQLRGLCDACV